MGAKFARAGTLEELDAKGRLLGCAGRGDPPSYYLLQRLLLTINGINVDAISIYQFQKGLPGISKAVLKILLRDDAQRAGYGIVKAGGSNRNARNVGNSRTTAAEHAPENTNAITP